jgi:hypothetical protein
MAVFASLTGQLAQLLSLSKSDHLLRFHVSPIPNPISMHSKQLQPCIDDAQAIYRYNAME